MNATQTPPRPGLSLEEWAVIAANEALREDLRLKHLGKPAATPSGIEQLLDGNPLPELAANPVDQ